MSSVQSFKAASVSAAAILAVCGAATAQTFTSDFEAPAYVPGLTTGQNGWYLPPVAGSQDHSVYAYTGNALLLSTNPSGGSQFDGGEGNATGPARAQHAVDFSSGGVWKTEFDCTGRWDTNVAATAIDNLGSYSLQVSTTARYFEQLMTWGSGAIVPYPGGPVPTNYTATFDRFHMPIGYFTAALPASITFELPSAAWTDLLVNHWFHVTVKWDFTSAQILEVSIKDLTANGPTTTDDVTARGWYLQGGPNSPNPLPTDVRVFAGGNGDISGWDNIQVYPVVTSSCYANCDHSTTVPFLNVSDFICFQSAFAAGNSYANCDLSTTPPVLNVSDFICFQGKFAAGCSAP
jgi:hypothetical protein